MTNLTKISPCWTPTPMQSLRQQTNLVSKLILLGTSKPLATFAQSFTWNFGSYSILYLEPFFGTWEPLRTLTWNPYLEPRNLPFRNLYLQPPLVAWNLHLKPFTWNLGTSWILYWTLEPPGSFTWNPFLEPWNLGEPSLGNLYWKLESSRNLPRSAPGPSLAESPLAQLCNPTAACCFPQKLQTDVEVSQLQGSRSPEFHENKVGSNVSRGPRILRFQGSKVPGIQELQEF